MEIKVVDNNVEKALRDMKRLMQKGGVLKELKEKRYFEKPSVKRKRKRLEAEKKRRKALRGKKPRD